MIRPFRVSLFIVGILFCYFFGETLEKFLLEVIRFVVPLDSSNAFVFNAVYILVAVSPLILFGVIGSVALGGELDSLKVFKLMVFGAILGIVFFRLYQIWWVFRGGLGEESSPWIESLTPRQMFFLEKVLPYILLGSASGFSSSFSGGSFRKSLLISLLSSFFSYFWLLLNRKLQNLTGTSQIAIMFLAASLSAMSICSLIGLSKNSMNAVITSRRRGNL